MRLMRLDGCWVGWALRSALWGVWSECEVVALVSHQVRSRACFGAMVNRGNGVA